jgi:signal transduction histidine kinase
VELRVVDRGPGVPPEVREHLFEPFFTTKHRGTGLGLATSRRIFEAHRGTIELECPPAGGTVAVIRLPAAG